MQVMYIDKFSLLISSLFQLFPLKWLKSAQNVSNYIDEFFDVVPHWLSKVIRVLIGFALLRSVIGQQNSHHRH